MNPARALFWLLASAAFAVAGLSLGHRGLSWSLVGAVLAAVGAFLMLVKHTSPKR